MSTRTARHTPRVGSPDSLLGRASGVGGASGVGIRSLDLAHFALDVPPVTAPGASSTSGTALDIRRTGRGRIDTTRRNEPRAVASDSRSRPVSKDPYE